MKSAFYLRKILVPFDGSHPCLQAEELVAAIAKNFKSKVTVIHLVSPELACM
ncbi:MAG: universal stress protein [Candidatus Bathyarchaeota archaeon]|nr:MAG: universal stress protein [Candidatus Bathyarchaeota archaeon]